MCVYVMIVYVCVCEALCTWTSVYVVLFKCVYLDICECMRMNEDVYVSVNVDMSTSVMCM